MTLAMARGSGVFAVDTLGGDLVMYVRDQLPRVLQERLSVTVESDAYHLRTRAYFADGPRTFDCLLEMQDFGGRKLACKIPDIFLAHLSAVF